MNLQLDSGNVQVLEKAERVWCSAYFGLLFDKESQSESKKIKQFLHTFMSSASARTTVNQPDSCCPSGIMDIPTHNYCEMAFGYYYCYPLRLSHKKDGEILHKRKCR